MKEGKAEEIKSLRRQGTGYDEIAKSLEMSKGTAYKYGKTVQVEEKRKEREELAPKTAKKEAFAKGMRTADSKHD